MSDSHCRIVYHAMIPYALDVPFPDGDFIFQDDLSLVHTSWKVRSLPEDRCVAELPWPPKGADLNIIVRVWWRMKVVMAQRPTTVPLPTNFGTRSKTNGRDCRANRTLLARSMIPYNCEF